MKKFNEKFDPEKIKDFQTWDEISKELFFEQKSTKMKKTASQRSKVFTKIDKI